MKVEFGPVENLHQGRNKEKWLNATFFVNRFYNNPCPNVFEIEEMYSDLLGVMKNGSGKNKKTSAKQIKDSLLSNIYSSSGVIYNIPNSSVMTINFIYKEDELFIDYDDDGRQLIVYGFKNRWIQTDGYYSYALSMVVHCPEGNAQYPFPFISFFMNRTPLLDQKHSPGNVEEASYVLKLVPEQPAPLFVPFNPRKEAIYKLRKWGFTDELIHYFDSIVYLVKKRHAQSDKLTPGEIMFNNYSTELLMKHKYHIPGNPNKKRTLRTISTLIELCPTINSPNNTINILYWKDDFFKPISNPTPRDRMEYKKYMENQLIVRW